MENASQSAWIRATGTGPPERGGNNLPWFQFLNFLQFLWTSMACFPLTVDRGIETTSIIILIDFASNVYQNKPQQTSSRVCIIKDKHHGASEISWS